MAYQVLARKYRPQRFADVIGQDHVTRTLLNALSQNRIAHGYIFSGHRGIGKTTIARILASALNCRCLLYTSSIVTVARKPFTRRSARRDAWRYHLREMALSEEPLRYIRKYLNVEEELSDEPGPESSAPKPAARRSKKATEADRDALPSAKPPAPLTRHPREKPIARPMPTGLPHFLKRPYP